MGKYMDDFFNIDVPSYEKEYERYCRNREETEEVNRIIMLKNDNIPSLKKVKIDRKVLFEICDAILNHYGYCDLNDCPENDSECFWNKWDDDFRKKVENIRYNS